MTMEHNDRLKQRLVGAAVLISLVVVFLPMLVEQGPEPSAGREAVSPRPDWKVADWQGGEYHAPAAADTAAQATLAVAAAGGQGNTTDADAGGDGKEALASATRAADAATTARPAAGAPADLIEAKVKPGDTLFGIFRRHGIAKGQVRELMKVSDQFSKLRPGQEMRFRIDDQGRIKAMEYRYGRGDPLRVKRIGGRLQVAGDQSALHAARPHNAANAKPATVARSKPSPTLRPTREQGPVAWVVKVGVYSDWETARALQAKLRSKRYPAFLTKSKGQDGHGLWSLKVGPRVKKADALALARQVEALTGTKTSVVSHR